MKVAVVGAGLAGCVLAKTLHDLGAEILLLEQGHGTSEPLLSEVFEHEAKPFGMRYTRTSGLGGSTSAWHSGLIRLQKSDLDQWFRWKPEALRSSLVDEISLSYKYAERLLIGDQVLRLDELEQTGKLLLHALGTSSDSLKARPIRLGQPPYNVHQLFGLADKERYPRLRTVCQVRDFKAIRNGAAGLREIEFRSGDGRKERVEVDCVVISAGGLASPSVLRGILTDLHGQVSPNVGYFYVDHPMGFLFRLKFRKPIAFGEFFGRKIGNEIVRFGLCSEDPLDGLNHICYLRPATSIREDADIEDVKRKLAEYRGGRYSPLYLLQVLRHIDLLMEAFSFRFGSDVRCSYATVMMVCEQEALKERGFYQLNSGRQMLRWFISDRERLSINRFVEFIKDHLQPILDDVAFDQAWGDSRLHSAAHHSGTCRIGSPSSGVVDEHLRVHGVDNLFVCDGSVIPNTGHANTGLTIAALAVRLARRLALCK